MFADAFGGKSLLEVVKIGGGGKNALGRHAVAALLNAASSNVSYAYTVNEVVNWTNAALAGGDVEALNDEFEQANEAGCPLGRAEAGGGNTGGGDTGGNVCVAPVIDGQIDDWNLAEDFFASMYEAGDSKKKNLSDAYVRYVDGKLHVLVLTTPGNVAVKSADDAWVKVYDLGNSTQVNGKSSSFRWVSDGNGKVIGYEASFPLAAGASGQVAIHLHVNIGSTSSTGKKRQGFLPLLAESACP